MEIPTRADIERRLHALIADFLDDLEADEPEGFNLGTVMLIAEQQTPWDGEVPLRRIEGQYTPANDFSVAWRMWCSDWRWWVQRSMLDEARVAFFQRDEASSSDESDDDERGDDG